MHYEIVRVKLDMTRAKTVAEFSEGFLSKAVDLILISIYFGFEFAATGYGNGWKAEAKSHEVLSELNYKTLKRAAKHLKQKGLVKTLKEKLELPDITEEGKEKIYRTIPKYNKRRLWDGIIYIITYDIPTKRNAQRNLLREFLRRIDCAPLQQSVWVTAYNPKKKIKDFVDEHNLQGFVVVSSLGKDGAIGDTQVSEIMREVYTLDNLNKRYKDFIVKAGMESQPKHSLVFSYLSILKQDPQLPYDLLPQKWLGTHAHEVFERISK